MSVVAAWRDGWARVLRAPWLIVGGWVSTLILALPLAHLLGRQIAAHLGNSLAAADAERGIDFDWWNEFLAQSAGLGQTFVPAILGFAGALKNISDIADAVPVASAAAPFVILGILLSLFLTGGVLDRLARNRAVGAAGFFATCGAYIFRLLRLGVISGVAYWFLFAAVHPLLFDDAYASLTRDLTVERTAFLYRLGLYSVFALLVGAVNLVFDYAKIRMVVEDRRSAIGSLSSSLRFIARQPGTAAGLYALNAATFAALLAVYSVVAQAGAATWTALLIGQLYVTARIVLRLLFAASQIALFQGRLAHAGYTAAPVPSWPDSAAAEAIRPS